MFKSLKLNLHVSINLLLWLDISTGFPKNPRGVVTEF